MDYIISETRNGNYIVQRPNAFGGLYPLVSDDADTRSTVEAFAAIAEDALDATALHSGTEEVRVTFRPFDHPENSFGSQS